TDRFAFEGFLPAKSAGRRARLASLAGEPRTLVFFEAANRLLEWLGDAADVLGGERQAVVARELTKLHETLYRDTLAGLTTRLADDADAARGEVVVVLEGRAAAVETGGDEALL
ncbi:rRNA (cytidine-2'-O-)-methyltransferase, partial [Arthrospira platensis SPKY2]